MKHSSGFTLLEVLLALSLLSMALLSMSIYQLKSMQYVKAAYLQNMAVNQLQEAVWLVEQKDLPLKNTLLPGMNYELNQSDIGLSWRNAVNVWRCDSASSSTLSCLSLPLLMD